MPKTSLTTFFIALFLYIFYIAAFQSSLLRLRFYTDLLQKQLALTVSELSDEEELVSASAARIASITHISLCEKSPSDINTIIMISKNKNQLSSNISPLLLTFYHNMRRDTPKLLIFFGHIRLILCVWTT